MRMSSIIQTVKPLSLIAEQVQHSSSNEIDTVLDDVIMKISRFVSLSVSSGIPHLAGYLISFDSSLVVLITAKNWKRFHIDYRIHARTQTYSGFGLYTHSLDWYRFHSSHVQHSHFYNGVPLLQIRLQIASCYNSGQSEEGYRMLGVNYIFARWVGTKKLVGCL